MDDESIIFSSPVMMCWWAEVPWCWKSLSCVGSITVLVTHSLPELSQSLSVFNMINNMKIISNRCRFFCLWSFLETCCCLETLVLLFLFDQHFFLWQHFYIYFSIECFCMSIKIDADNSFKQIIQVEKIK